MNDHFESLLNSPLPEDIKALVRKWNTLSENLRGVDCRVPVLLPDLFWIVHSGAGKTTFLHRLTDYLKAQGNLMDFYGDVDSFEFLLGYCPEQTAFTELQRLMDAVKNAAGFRNEYRGVMCIDIDEWVDHYTEKHFISFMEYLAANSEHWLILLSVSPNQDDKLQELQAFLSMYLRLETIHMDLPSDEEMVAYIEKTLADYGFALSEDAAALLTRTLSALRKNTHFDGYKSVRLLSKDIVYHLYSGETLPEKTLTAAHLANFAETSRYVQNMIFTASHSGNPIGFLD